MALRGRRSIGNTILKVIGYFLLGGLLIALLRAFDFDPFGIIDWIWNIGTSILNKIADWFSNNDTFQNVTRAPSE